MARLLGRALLLRCPLCGHRGLFRQWVRMQPVCRGCGLKTDRGEADAFIGGYTVNFVVAEVCATMVMFAVLVVTWPAVPWRALMFGGVVLMTVLPVLFYPFSRMFWLAIDLTFQPPAEADFTVRPGAASTRHAEAA